MPFGTDIIITYDDNNLIDDVMEFVIGLTPTKTPLFSGLPKEKAKGKVHTWKEQSLTTAQDNAANEGGTFGNPQHDQPGDAFNFTQIFEKVYHVSSTDMWVEQYGIENQFTKQETDAMKKILTDVELAILKGSIASGNVSPTGGRRLGGFLNYISDNKSTMNSGVKLTESGFNDFLQAVFDNGGDVDEIYTNSFLKRVISTFTSGTTKEIDAKDRRVVNKVSIYESDFGLQQLFIHRNMPNTSNSDSGLLFIDRMKNYIAIGEPIHPLSLAEVAQTTHGRKGVTRGELTLAPQAQLHQAVAMGFWNAFN